VTARRIQIEQLGSPCSNETNLGHADITMHVDWNEH